MGRAEIRRNKKENLKRNMPAPLNVSNYTIEQIAKASGTKVEMVKMWVSAREKEMFDAFMKESQEKLWKAEDYIAVGNILISLYAIKMTWGYTKANQKFLNNINAAKAYVERLGIEKAYEQLHKEMGIELEFDSIDINKEFGFGEYNDKAV